MLLLLEGSLWDHVGNWIVIFSCVVFCVLLRLIIVCVFAVIFICFGMFAFGGSLVFVFSYRQGNHRIYRDWYDTSNQ